MFAYPNRLSIVTLNSYLCWNSHLFTSLNFLSLFFHEKSWGLIDFNDILTKDYGESFN